MNETNSFPTNETDLSDLDDLIYGLKDIKMRQKALAEKESLWRAEIQKIMEQSGLIKEKTKYGTVRLQSKIEKQYNEEIISMEQSLKEAKKLADDLGDYSVIGHKQTLVYISPKEE
jgi:transcription initiation factor IIF auxiliary subunit